MTQKQKSLLAAVILIMSLMIISHFAMAAFFNKEALNVSLSNTDAGYPAIAVSPNGENIGIVWSDRYATGTTAEGPIYFKAATGASTSSATLTLRLKVDDSESASDQSLAPDIANDPNTETNMHVVWQNKGTSDYKIFYALCLTSAASSCEQSSNHETVVAVNQSTDNESVEIPRVATANKGGTTVAHTVWQFDDLDTVGTAIYYSARVSSSADWATNTKLVSSDGVTATQPAIAADGTYVHVVWASDLDQDGSNDKIVYRRGITNTAGVASTWDISKTFTISGVINGGTTVTAAQTIGAARPAIVALSNGTVMIAWDEQVASPDDNYDSGEDRYYAAFVVSNDAGATFQQFGDRPEQFIFDSRGYYALSEPTGSSFPSTNPHVTGLKLSLAAYISGSNNITSEMYAVWHETSNADSTNYHDVWSATFWYGNSGCGSCNNWTDIEPTNETTGTNKLGGSSATYYSMSPDIAAANRQYYAVYMESKNDGEWQIIDKDTEAVLSVFDVIFKGSIAISDTTTNNPATQPTVYLPIILKNG